MSYSKHRKMIPSIENYSEFFTPRNSTDDQSLWQEFYNDVRDASWPECDSFDDVHKLPWLIQQEIQCHWTPAQKTISSDYELLEFLTLSYYDSFMQPSQNLGVTIYQLERYLNNDFDDLKKINKMLGWTWKESKSDKFYQYVLEKNRLYLTWLEDLKMKYDIALATHVMPNSLELWETAVMLAKIFVDLDKNPRHAKWQNSRFSFDTNSLQLTKLLGI